MQNANSIVWGIGAKHCIPRKHIKRRTGTPCFNKRKTYF